MSKDIISIDNIFDPVVPHIILLRPDGFIKMKLPNDLKISIHLMMRYFKTGVKRTLMDFEEITVTEGYLKDKEVIDYLYKKWNEKRQA